MIDIHYTYTDPETKFILTEVERRPHDDMSEALNWAVGRVTFDFPSKVFDVRLQFRLDDKENKTPDEQS